MRIFEICKKLQHEKECSALCEVLNNRQRTKAYLTFFAWEKRKNSYAVANQMFERLQEKDIEVTLNLVMSRYNKVYLNLDVPWMNKFNFRRIAIKEGEQPF